MQFANVCPFCKDNLFINNQFVGLPIKDSLLYESKNLYVGVDISPICRGHILIITKEHYFNFYALPIDIKKEVQELQEKLKKLYKEVYKKDILFFEHGSNKSGTAGSSIDHAHLHCIPSFGDIKNILYSSLGESVPCSIMEDTHYKNEFPYVFIQNNDENILYPVEKLPSQFLRKVLVNKLSETDYLWQDRCLRKDSVNAFYETIKDLKGKIS